VVLASANEAPELVLGLRTVRGSELVRELTRPDGGFRAETDRSPLTLLVGQPSEPVLAVIDDWLVTARDAATARAAGIYLARSLGVRPRTDAPLTLVTNRLALAGPLAEAVKARWAALRAGLDAQARATRGERGRAPDFGDPDALLGLGDGAVGALIELLRSSDRLTITLNPAEDRLELAVVLVPQPDGALARSIDELEVGSVKPLLELPESVVAVLSRSSDRERSASAEKPADALRSVLGSRLSERDAAPLADALRSLHRGRANVTLFGVLADGSPFLKQEVRDPKELERGARRLLELTRLPALAEPLEQYAGKLKVHGGTTSIPGVAGPVIRAEVVPTGRGSKPGELLIRIDGAHAVAVASDKAREGLVALTAGAPSLGASPVVSKLAEHRPPAAIAVYADLQTMLLVRHPAGAAPVLAVLGKRQREAVLELALSAPACAALLERMGSP